MAFATAYYGVNMNAQVIFPVDVMSIGSTWAYLYGADGEEQRFIGSGVDYYTDLNGDYVITAGSVSNTTYYEDGIKIYEITGLGGKSAVTLYNHWVTNNNQGFLSYLFNGDDTLVGSPYADLGNGYAGYDVLFGMGGGDRLNGGPGPDDLIGGPGKDTLTGGTGADWFVFERAPSASSTDTIKDFNRGQGDSIVLEKDYFAIGTALDAAEYKVSTTINPNGGNGASKILYDSDSGRLYYDADGGAGAAPILFAILEGAPRLTRADFEVG